MPDALGMNEMLTEDVFLHSKKKYKEINLSYLVLDPQFRVEICGVG